MVIAMFYLNWVGIFGSLIAAALLIAGLTFGFRLMKVSYAPAWAVLCVALLGAYFAAAGGGANVLFLLLFGVPLLGAAAYLTAKFASAKQIGIVAAVGLLVCGFIFVLRSGSYLELENHQHARSTEQMHDTLLNEQALRVRALREDFDRQRRDLFDSRITRSQPNDDSAAGSSPPDDQVETMKSSSGVAWYPEVDERFDADIQPSMAATGQALGKRLIPLIKSATREEQEPSVIQIYAARTRQHEDFRQALSALATVVRSRYPGVKVMVQQTAPENSITQFDPNAISIRLTMSVVQLLTPAPWDKSKSELLADVTAELRGHTRTASVSVRLVDKPWIHDIDRFLSSSRSDGILIDGRSGRLATKRTDARDAAIDDAVSLLTPVATEVLKAQKQLLIRTPDEEEIAARLKQELLAGQLVVDTFSQQLAHPMGNLWREAVLVRVDYPWLERVFSTYLQQRQEEQRDRLSLGAALALLAAGIVVLHAVLNWITKGYHRKSVGMLSGLLAVAGVLMILIIAIKFFGPGQVEAVPVKSIDGRFTL
jgi:hypothetical protein